MSRRLKIFLLLAVFSLATFFAPRSVTAYSQSYIDALKSQDYNLESMVSGKDTLDPNAPSGMGNILINYLGLKLMGPLEKDMKNVDNQLNDGSVLNGMTRAIATLYTPPTSTVYYLAKMSPVKSIYAQSPNPDSFAGRSYPGGFQVLEPVQKLWTVFRNISYLFFIVIFVIIGFMIMFRSKLDPQTVLNIQLALPKIIVALIGVTFSYAFAALIIDICQIATALIVAILLNSQQIGGLLPGLDANFSLNFFTIMEKFLLTSTLQGANPFACTDPAGCNIISGIIDTIGKAVQLISFNQANMWELILDIVVITSIFKVFFMLLTNYVQLIFGVIFSPFVFLQSALGGKSSIGSWIRSQISYALVFPVTLAILVIALILSNNELVTLPGQTLTKSFPWVPPVLPLSQDTVGAFLAFGILMILPNIAATIQRALQVQASPAGEMGEGIRNVAKMIPVVGSMI